MQVLGATSVGLFLGPHFREIGARRQHVGLLRAHASKVAGAWAPLFWLLWTQRDGSALVPIVWISMGGCKFGVVPKFHRRLRLTDHTASGRKDS